MARLEVRGVEELINSFDEICGMPESVAADILNAEADVLVRAQREQMLKMWKGPYSTGDTARSVKKGKVRHGRRGIRSITVYPDGDSENRKGERHATVAFINEYGKRGQPPRPAIRTANNEALDQVIDAGEKIFGNYLKSKNL